MLPVPGAVQGTPFGARSRLWSCSRNSANEGIHTGVDFPADAGTIVLAARPGVASYDDHGSAFGNHQLAIRCDDGTRDFYAHMSARLVADGAAVAVGQPVGRVGAEGNVTGPHLHFERHTVTSGAWSCSIITNPQPSLDWEDRMTPDEWTRLEKLIDARLEANNDGLAVTVAKAVWAYVVRPARKATATEPAVSEQTAQAALKKAANTEETS